MNSSAERKVWWRRRAIVVGTAVVGVNVAVSCQNWFDWDAVFDRAAPGSPSLPSPPPPATVWTTPPPIPGWQGGDGAPDIPLDNRTIGGIPHRETLWTHGDSRIFANPATSNIVLTNTIAITDVPTSAPKGQPPTNDKRKWYARKSGAPTTVKEVTDGINGADLPFFLGENPTNSLWPGDGVRLGTQLFVFGFEMTRATPPGRIDNYVYSISNPTAAITSWNQPARTSLRTTGGTSQFSAPALQLLWGETVYKTPGSTLAYIFGISVAGINWADLSLSTATPLYLARADATTINFYEQWEFYKQGGVWQTGAPAALVDLQKIGNIADATEFSVEKVSMNNDQGVLTERYVMVHGRPRQGDDVIVQVSKISPFSITNWEDFNAGTASQYHWIGSLTGALDTSVKTGTITECPDIQKVWATKGHWTLSPGTTTLMVSYYPSAVNYGADVGSKRNFYSCAAGMYYPFSNLRFANGVDLIKIKPWCTSNCWN